VRLLFYSVVEIPYRSLSLTGIFLNQRTMRKFLLPLLLIPTLSASPQDTFSIVAVDSATGYIGSAGASCINNSKIISDIIPGRGAIHTQSYWVSANQQNAHDKMVEGLSPQEIIDWLVENDHNGDPSIRQYGIVDFDSSGSPRSAAFTGENCLDDKYHTAGSGYAIQGNILIDSAIIDSMEARFLAGAASFAERLMAALQGARVPGADSRCLAEGVSAKSAFIRMARPEDTLGTFYLDLNVPSRPYGIDPIDSLQVLFDDWLQLVTGIGNKEGLLERVKVYPNPSSDFLIAEFHGPVHRGLELKMTDLVGNEILSETMTGIKLRIDIRHLRRGIYFLSIFSGEGISRVIKIIKT
jgi:uncharacterized Ntn-hydrolase superfamily protein